MFSRILAIAVALLAVGAARGADNANARSGVFALSAHESWSERMWRQLNRKMTIEFKDEKLADALELVSGITGVNMVIDPKVRLANPVVTIRVTEMDAGTLLMWLTELSGTFAELKDQAIYITDHPSKEADADERQHILMLAAEMRAAVDLPPEGVALTDADRVKIALQLLEKEAVKPQDFPGPEMGFDMGEKMSNNPFGK